MPHLRNTAKQILSAFSGGVSMRSLIRVSGQKLFLPVYHLVCNEAPVHIRHLYQTRNERLFRQDLDFLLKHFQPLDFNALNSIVFDKKPLHKPGFFLTFDDGLREIHEVVAPILREKGVPAAFFLNSAFLDNAALFFRYKASILIEALNQKTVPETAKKSVAKLLLENRLLRPGELKNSLLALNYNCRDVTDETAKLLEVDFDEYLKNQKPYLTTAQTQELIAQGFYIGAHSHDHPEYQTVPLTEQLQQTKISTEIIAQKFNLAYNWFAFPFTDEGVPKPFFDKIFGPDTATRIDISFGSAGLKHDIYPQHLQRFPMEGTLLPAKHLIKTEYLYYLAKAPFGKNNLHRT